MRRKHKWAERAVVLLITLAAFGWGIAAAWETRGYAAFGGEFLLLLLPLLYYTIRKIAADWIKEVQGRRK